MAKSGPKGPSVKIDWNEFESLCGLHCTLLEIANFFHCSEDTIDRHVKKKYDQDFAVVFKLKSGEGKLSLRRKMFAMAMAGDSKMCMWLSKNYLGMADKIETKNDNVNSFVDLIRKLDAQDREAEK